LSIDDLYLPHVDQEALAKSHPDNPLVQHRGQPSTHDISLGISLLNALANRERNIKIPSYDKSAFSGAGDRRPGSEWETVNADGQPPVEVVILEGWCVGFRALSDAEVERKWKNAKAEFERNPEAYQGQLGRLELSSVMFVNEKLREYDALTDRFGAFMMMWVLSTNQQLLCCVRSEADDYSSDAEDTQYVYAWRREQEAALRASKGTGMTDEQVIKFVNGCESASINLYSNSHGLWVC
jgi:D-glycerate 3-kinase